MKTGVKPVLILIHSTAAGYFATSSADYSYLNLAFKTCKTCGVKLRVKRHLSSFSMRKKKEYVLH